MGTRECDCCQIAQTFMVQARRELLRLFCNLVAFLFTLVALLCLGPMRRVIARASLCLSVVTPFAFKVAICKREAR